MAAVFLCSVLAFCLLFFPSSACPQIQSEGELSFSEEKGAVGVAKIGKWQKVAPGLELGRFPSAEKSKLGSSIISVLRISPQQYSFRLLCSSQYGRRNRTVKEWSREFGLVAAINASMFQRDGFTSTGLMKNYGHANNPKLNPNYKSILVFNPAAPNLPEVQLLDLQCDNFGALRKKYNTVVQNLRMISCRRENVWSPQDRRWSMVSLGVDGKGNVLFVFTRFPYSVNEFINILLGIKIDVQRAMYLEGGPPASLYLRTGQMEMELWGSFETGFNENDENDSFWPVPNAIGISTKRKDKSLVPYLKG
jgi:hypothetical protein